MINIDYRMEEYKLIIDEFRESGVVDCNYLDDAVKFITSDPKMSLVKVRIVLETIVYEVYKVEMEKEPKKTEIGPTLGDTQFQKKIDTRIFRLMDSIRGVSNMGPHEVRLNGSGTEPIPEDAMSSLEQLLQVIKWYVEKYNGRVSTYGNQNIKTGNINNEDNSIDIQSRKQSINQTIIHGQVSGIVNAGNGTVNIINKK